MVGGLYGVSIGRIFFGESMFALEADASKLALVALCTNNVFPRYHLIDCQIESEHLKSLGANLISRSDFERRLTHIAKNNLALFRLILKFDNGPILILLNFFLGHNDISVNKLKR